jgi:ankyrin repeat protein
MLIQKDANVNQLSVKDNTKEDRNQLTPLILAARNSHLNVVELLLKHGADPNIFDVSETCNIIAIGVYVYFLYESYEYLFFRVKRTAMH